MKTWITSDWHLGEDRFELMGRPFKTEMEMIEVLRKNHNELVAPEDTVIVAGDVCYKKYADIRLCFVQGFNGKKILIRGNHDTPISDKQFLYYFEKVIPEGDGIEMDIQGLPCYITHYPSQGKKNKFNLVGHIHAAWKYQLNMLNVGVDVHHFKPVDLNSVWFHFEAITKFYDQDVWSAYNPINASFQTIRGVQDTYFKRS